MSIPDLYRVAEIYLSAAQRGEPPCKAVEESFGAPRATASRWIAKAKNAGHIPPTGVAGVPLRRNAKAIAVAHALGVTYDALCDAVREHADGDLRISGP